MTMTRRGMTITATLLLAGGLMLGGCAGKGKSMSAVQRSRAKFAPVEGARPVPRGDELRVVFLVDLTDRPDGVSQMILQRLGERIELLEPSHAFTVIVVQGNEAVEAEPAGLKFASATTKAEAKAWLSPEAGHVKPPLAIEPTQALELARWYHPHHLFILTGDLKRTLPGRYLSMLPTEPHRTRVNVVQFFNDNEKSLEWVQYVTREHRGSWRFVARPQPAEPVAGTPPEPAEAPTSTDTSDAASKTDQQ